MSTRGANRNSAAPQKTIKKGPYRNTRLGSFLWYPDRDTLGRLPADSGPGW